MLSDQKVLEIRASLAKEQKTLPHLYRARPFRYVCNYCEKFAFQSKTKKVFEEIKCTNCGRIITECDMSRYKSYER